MDAFAQMLTPHYESRPPDLTKIQARAPGLSLMALSNKLGAMLLTTATSPRWRSSPRSTAKCGGYNVLKDLYKTDVYALRLAQPTQCPFFGVAVSPLPSAC